MRHLKTFESYAAAGSVDTLAIVDYFTELYTPEACYEFLAKYAPQAIDQLESMMTAGPAPMSERRTQNKYNKYRRIYEGVELTPEEQKKAEEQANTTLGITGFATTLGGAVTTAVGAAGFLESDGSSDFSGPHGSTEGSRMHSDTTAWAMIGIGIATMLIGAYQWIRYGKRNRQWEKKWSK
jgi:hypothetical protein